MVRRKPQLTSAHAEPLRIGFVLPGPLDAVSGGYAYDRRMMAELAAHGLAARPVLTPFAAPIASAQAEAETADILRAEPGPLLIDGLAIRSLTADAAAELGPRSAALIHHPLALEAGLSAGEAAHLRAREQSILAQMRRVLVTSPRTAATVTEMFGVPSGRITAAPPGVDPAPRAPCVGEPPRILMVGGLIPRKGYGAAIEAFRQIAGLPWRCDIVGSRSADRDEAAHVAEIIRAAGLSERVRLLGSVSDADLSALYAGADLFLSTSEYEGYGMAVAEAVNRGLPIVLNPAGALAETAPHAVRPDGAGPDAFAAALRRLLEAPADRRAAADASWAARTALPRWDASARTIADALKEVFQ